MRIKRVECEQFAGIQDKELEFEKGMNIVIGANETGKSTMIDLIYHLLFKDVKIDGRSDAAFMDKYFPKKVEGPQGDVVDGRLVFETGEGTYKLRKEWEKGEGSARLTLPDGTSIKGMDAINNILCEELKARAGVYSEIVFPSQKREQMALESIMKTLSKKADSLADTREDLVSVLTQASLETGGVCLEKIEKELKSVLDELAFRWDFMTDMPEGGIKRGVNNKWSIKVDNKGILKAYYEAEEVRLEQVEVENTEKIVEEQKSKIKELNIKKKTIEDKKEAFQKYSSVLAQASVLKESIKHLETQIDSAEKACTNWPKLEDGISKAKELKIKQEQAVIHSKYMKVSQARKDYLDKKDKLESAKEVDTEDIRSLKDILRTLQREESKLAGLDIIAQIKKLGDSDIDVNSISTGEAIVEVDGKYSIKEAVAITIPGVMELQLMPQGIDIEQIQGRISGYKSEINKIYKKYSIGDISQLEHMAQDYEILKRAVDEAKRTVDMLLIEDKWEDLEQLHKDISEDIETEEIIRHRVNELCDGRTLDGFIGAYENMLNTYTSTYESVEGLKLSVEKWTSDLNKKKVKLESLDEVPEEFKGIEDADEFDARLQRNIDGFAAMISEQEQILRAAEIKLGERSAEEYMDKLLEKTAVLEARKTEYKHWKHIYEVYINLKESTTGNPIEDIEIHFREYLDIISSGGVALRDIDEQLSCQLASGKRALTYDILSEGTKDTIALAFRLALLEHLYPEGDGLAVFDDPFTDMDPKRVEQACNLIQKFAKNNQVIFITCDDKYVDMLEGNIIKMTNI